MDQTPIHKIVDAVQNATGHQGRWAGRDRWQGRCPAHPDHNPSLSIGQNQQEHALVCCQTGCSTSDVLGAAGLTLRDLYPLRPENRSADPVVARYDYTDAAGHLLFQVERTVAKRFRQRRPEGTGWVWNLDGVTRVLYRLPQVIAAVQADRTVWVVEGEKDVHSLEARGEVATCNPGGVGKWRSEYNQVLRGAIVNIVADQDSHGKGLAHASEIYHQLMQVAGSVTLLRPAVGKDITDHLTAGVELEELLFQTPTPTDTRTGASQADGDQDRPVRDTFVQPALPVPQPRTDHGKTNGGPPPPDGPVKKLRLIRASSIPIKAARWVWDGRMPLGELCLIAGREGVGKSTFLAWLAARITTGTLEGIHAGTPKAVLYAASEDDWSYTIAPRMRAAGANLDLVYHIDVDDDGQHRGLVLPKDGQLLPEKAKEVDAAVLMCDPILSLVDGAVNPNHSKELRTALEPLSRAAREAELAIPALVHFNKSQHTDGLTMIAGSRAWTEVARAVMLIAQDPDASEYRCVISQRKNNLGRTDLANYEYTIRDAVIETSDGGETNIGRLVMTGQTSDDAEEILARGTRRDGGGSDAGKIGPNIQNYLSTQVTAQSPREIADALAAYGYGYHAVRKQLARMADRDELRRIGTGLYAAVEVSKRICAVCGQWWIPSEDDAGLETHPGCQP